MMRHFSGARRMLASMAGTSGASPAPAAAAAAAASSLLRPAMPRIPHARPDERPETTVARLTYQSRKRGILETDLLLSTFAARHLPELAHAELLEYERLLEEYDWDIYYWVTGKKVPPPHIAEGAVFRRIVEHARNTGREILRMPDL